MKRMAIFIYGILAYMIGLGGLTYFILFVGGWDFLPIHINSGQPGDLGIALLINVGLIALFGLQHSVMARPSFKKVLTRIIPKSAERSTFVMLSGIMMLLICLFWQPIDGVLWQVNNQIGSILLTVGYAFGWVLAVSASFVINHFELFGLQQVYMNLRNKTEPTPQFTDRLLYRLVRHPLQLGVLIGIWIIPTMTVTHMMLSVAMTVYIFIGLYFEEKDLVASLGKEYEEYQKRVPKILPLPRPTTAPQVGDSELTLEGSLSGD